MWQAERRPTVKQHEGDDRIDEKGEPQTDPPRWRARHQQPRDEQRADGEDEIDPPALIERIGAIDEIGQLLGDGGPAGPVRRAAGGGVAMPDGAEEEIAQQIGHGPDGKDQSAKRERQRFRRTEEIARQSGNASSSPHGRRQSGRGRGADKSLRQCTAPAMRWLKRFIASEPMSETKR